MPPRQSQSQSVRLGEFLRLHRERLSPEVAGLPATSSRRRTPGLRREELAQLCHVSATWITWLEQGRDVKASPAALARIAGALRLQRAERDYLFALAGERDPDSDLPAAVHEPFAMTVAAMKCPAYILDHRWDVVAFNRPAAELFSVWDRSATPNLLRFMFTDPHARKLVVDWKSRARRLVAEFRADCGRKIDSLAIQSLVAELSAASAEFARAWNAHDVQAREGGERRFNHPKRGRVAYDQVTLLPATNSAIKIVLLLGEQKVTA